MDEVVEHDGSALRRHAAGEASTERNTDAALDLLLDPDRRTRYNSFACSSRKRTRTCPPAGSCGTRQEHAERSSSARWAGAAS